MAEHLTCSHQSIGIETAFSKVRAAGIAAYFYGAVLGAVGLLGYAIDDLQEPLSRYLSSAAFFDAGVMVGLAVYVGQRSLVGVLLLLAYFLLAQIIGPIVQGRTLMLLVSVPLLYWFWHGLSGILFLRKHGQREARSAAGNIVYWTVGVIGGAGLVTLLGVSLLEAAGLLDFG